MLDVAPSSCLNVHDLLAMIRSYLGVLRVLETLTAIMVSSGCIFAADILADLGVSMAVVEPKLQARSPQLGEALLWTVCEELVLMPSLRRQFCCGLHSGRSGSRRAEISVVPNTQRSHIGPRLLLLLRPGDFSAWLLRALLPLGPLICLRYQLNDFTSPTGSQAGG